MIVAWMLRYAEQTDDDIQGAYQSGLQREFADFVKKKNNCRFREEGLQRQQLLRERDGLLEGKVMGQEEEEERERDREREVLLTVKK